jgi:hypothetical protein
MAPDTAAAVVESGVGTTLADEEAFQEDPALSRIEILKTNTRPQVYLSGLVTIPSYANLGTAPDSSMPSGRPGIVPVANLVVFEGPSSEWCMIGTTRHCQLSTVNC